MTSMLFKLNTVLILLCVITTFVHSANKKKKDTATATTNVGVTNPTPNTANVGVTNPTPKTGSVQHLSNVMLYNIKNKNTDLNRELASRRRQNTNKPFETAKVGNINKTSESGISTDEEYLKLGLLSRMSP